MTIFAVDISTRPGGPADMDRSPGQVGAGPDVPWDHPTTVH